MPTSKLLSLSEAISRFVPDGSAVAMGTALESLIPFAAGHEIVRQRKRDLTLIGPISDILFDQLIGAGCVRRVRAAWVGNVITGSAYNFRRAVESGTVVESRGDTAVVGAYADDCPAGSSCGSAYVYRMPDERQLAARKVESRTAGVATLEKSLVATHRRRVVVVVVVVV
ncbi:MAG: catI, partial [Anaerolineales bacterium]|nr:catI [Anaerolineales bacterium]